MSQSRSTRFQLLCSLGVILASASQADERFDVKGVGPEATRQRC